MHLISLIAEASLVAGYGLQAHELQQLWLPAPEHRLSICGTRAPWHVGSSRIEPGSPALAGRFFTTEPPGKPGISCF